MEKVIANKFSRLRTTLIVPRIAKQRSAILNLSNSHEELTNDITSKVHKRVTVENSIAWVNYKSILKVDYSTNARVVNRW